MLHLTTLISTDQLEFQYSPPAPKKLSFALQGEEVALSLRVVVCNIHPDVYVNGHKDNDCEIEQATLLQNFNLNTDTCVTYLKMIN